MLRFSDSVEYTTTLSHKYDTVTGAIASTSAKRTGNQGIFLNGGNSRNVQRNIGGTSATIVAGHAVMYVTTLPSTTISVIQFFEGSTLHVDCRITSAGKLQITRNGTQLGSDSAAIIVAGAFYYIELKATIHDSTGSAEVRVNEIAFVSVSGTDTRNGGTGIIDKVSFGSNQGTGAVDQYLDDIYILDDTGSRNNNYLGDVKVECIMPDGNGNSSQFVGSDGNSTDNYLLVDEQPPNDDTDYVQSSTVNDKDTYTYGALTTTDGTVKAVVAWPRAKKTDAGTRSFRALARHSASEADNGADFTLSTSYLYFLGLFETNPSTTTDWTITEVNAAEFGAKLTA